MAVGSATLRGDFAGAVWVGGVLSDSAANTRSSRSLVWAERVLVRGAAARYQDPDDDQSHDRCSASRDDTNNDDTTS